LFRIILGTVGYENNMVKNTAGESGDRHLIEKEAGVYAEAK